MTIKSTISQQLCSFKYHGDMLANLTHKLSCH